MKKIIALVLILMMLCAPVAVYAEEWDMSVSTEITDEIQAMFDKAMDGLTGVNYTPVAVLGRSDDTTCILCKAVVVYPLWIDKHAEKEEFEDGTSNCA